MIALGYPVRPDAQDVKAYRSFFVALGPVLPCQSCSSNYQAHMLELKEELEEALDKGGRALFDWTVALHNIVNREHGKRELTPKQAVRELEVATRPVPFWGLFTEAMSPRQAVSIGTGILIGLLVGVGGTLLYKSLRKPSRCAL